MNCEGPGWNVPHRSHFTVCRVPRKYLCAHPPTISFLEILGSRVFGHIQEGTARAGPWEKYFLPNYEKDNTVNSTNTTGTNSTHWGYGHICASYEGFRTDHSGHGRRKVLGWAIQDYWGWMHSQNVFQEGKHFSSKALSQAWNKYTDC